METVPRPEVKAVRPAWELHTAVCLIDRFHNPGYCECVIVIMAMQEVSELLHICVLKLKGSKTRFVLEEECSLDRPKHISVWSDIKEGSWYAEPPSPFRRRRAVLKTRIPSWVTQKRWICLAQHMAQLKPLVWREQNFRIPVGYIGPEGRLEVRPVAKAEATQQDP